MTRMLPVPSAVLVATALLAAPLLAQQADTEIPADQGHTLDVWRPNRPKSEKEHQVAKWGPRGLPRRRHAEEPPVRDQRLGRGHRREGGARMIGLAPERGGCGEGGKLRRLRAFQDRPAAIAADGHDGNEAHAAPAAASRRASRGRSARSALSAS